MKTTTIAVTLGAVALSLAAVACKSPVTTTSPGQPRAAAATSSPAAPRFTCAGISASLQAVLSDQKSSDAAQQEAWVTGGHSGDLNQLISDTSAATQTRVQATQLGRDADAFNRDASGYLSSGSGFLYPGWQQDYNILRTDINALAADCGLSPVS